MAFQLNGINAISCEGPRRPTIKRHIDISKPLFQGPTVEDRQSQKLGKPFESLQDPGSISTVSNLTACALTKVILAIHHTLTRSLNIPY